MPRNGSGGTHIGRVLQQYAHKIREVLYGLLMPLTRAR